MIQIEGNTFLNRKGLWETEGGGGGWIDGNGSVNEEAMTSAGER